MNVLEAICKADLSSIINHTAIITSRGPVSYKQLDKKIKNVSEYLNSLGIGQGSNVALLGGNSSDYVFYLLALWNLNACVIPLNTMLIDYELSSLINFSDAEFLFYDKGFAGDIPSGLIRKPLSLSFNDEKPFNEATVDTIRTALNMFTSGATGKPKGVMHSLDNLINSADNSQSLLMQTENDKWLASLPFYHIGGLSIIVRSLRFGSSLIIPDSLNNEDLKKTFVNLSPSLASLVSTQLKRLLDSGWKPGTELRTILLGGGFTDGKLVEEAAVSGCRVANVYGSTETSAFVTALNPDSVFSKPLSAGKALGNNQISIVDSNLNRLPRNTPGEILIEGNSLFKGYYKDENRTNTVLRGGKYLTGDIGYIDYDGDLFVEARRTDLIVTGGENVNPFEIEGILNNIPGIRDCCVFPLADKEWGQMVAAAVVIDKNLSDKEITASLKGKISGYKIPKRIFPVEKIPRSPLGKIMREKVKEEIEALLKVQD